MNACSMTICTSRFASFQQSRSKCNRLHPYAQSQNPYRDDPDGGFYRRGIMKRRRVALILVLMGGVLGHECSATPAQRVSARMGDYRSDFHADLSGTPLDRFDLSHTTWSQIARKHGLSPYLLYAVALVESSRGNGLLVAPWPWAINHAGHSTYHLNRASALHEISTLQAKGQHSMDIGLMQINLRWQGQRVNHVHQLLDPKTNVEIGAQILSEALSTAPGDPILGVGRYHAWNNKAEAYRYGRRVWDIAHRLSVAPVK